MCFGPLRAQRLPRRNATRLCGMRHPASESGATTTISPETASAAKDNGKATVGTRLFVCYQDGRRFPAGRRDLAGVSRGWSIMSLKHLQTVVGFRSDDGVEISDQRIRLLEAIDSLGSISAAARTVGLTYRGAWDAVAAINALAEQPLVLGRTGGKSGGGASLTEDGRRFLRAVQLIRRELHRVARTVSIELGSDVAVPALSWKHFLRTSARNMLLCKVAEVKHGAVNAEILLDVAEGIHLVAIITEASVTSLELAAGKDVFALIKSSFVVLAAAAEIGRTSARNVLTGTVARREDGAVSSEIILDLGSGKSIAAIVTKESANSLGFKLGDKACALIKASHIILAVD